MGDLMLDRYVIGDCERISPEAPVQVVDVSEEHVTLGGAGNVVANAIALGARASVAGVVGDDPRRPVLMGLLQELGADSRHVIAEAGRRVTEKTRIVAAGQQVVRFDVENRRAHIRGERGRSHLGTSRRDRRGRRCRSLRLREGRADSSCLPRDR